MGDRPPVGARDHVAVEHHKAPSELQDAAMALDLASLGLAQKVDVEIGGHGQRVGTGVREYADITADIRQREEGRTGYRAAGSEMPIGRVQSHRAAAGEYVCYLKLIALLVELRKHLREEPVDLLYSQKRCKTGLLGHRSPGLDRADAQPLWDCIKQQTHLTSVLQGCAC